MREVCEVFIGRVNKMLSFNFVELLDYLFKEEVYLVKFLFKRSIIKVDFVCYYFLFKRCLKDSFMINYFSLWLKNV